MKKKAIKIAAASAIAASAFVSVTPTFAATNLTTTVDQAVMQMQKAYHTYSDITATGKFADTKAVDKEYNLAKAAYKNAKAAVVKAGGKQKDALLAKLDSNFKTYITDRVVPYLDAANYINNHLQPLKDALETALAGKDLAAAAAAEANYHAISSELKRNTFVIYKVYGESTRNLFKVKKAEAEELRNSIRNEVTVKMAYDAAVKALATPDLATAKAQIDKAEAVSFDKNTEIGKALVAYGNTVKAQYEALVTPAVVSVSAINATQLVVKFNQPVLGETADVANDATDVANYKLGNATANSAVLSSDKRSVTLTFASVEGEEKVLVVNPVATPKKDKDGAVVSSAKYTQVLSFKDTVKPEVVGTSYANGKITLEFSEAIGTVPSVVRVNGTPVTTIAAGDAPNKVDVTYTLAAGSTANLYVAGAKDAAKVANEMSLFTGTVIAPAADNGKPQVVGVQVTGQNTAKVTVSEKLVADTIIAKLQQGATQTDVTLVKDADDTTGKTYTLTVAGLFATGTSTSETFTLYIAKDAMSDLATPANKNDLFSTTVTFNKDLKAPAFVSSQVSADNKKLEFKFDENLVVAQSNANIVIKNSDGVKLSAVDAESVVKSDDAKTYQVDTKAGDKVLDAGTYTVTIPAAFFTDAYGNKSAAVTSTFTVGASSNTDTTKPTATVDKNGKNVFEVTYNEEVSASALNLANYKLDGKDLPAGTEVFFTSTSKKVVDIVLPTNSINIGDQTTGASAILTVGGVADKAGNVINTFNSGVVVNDNTAATIQSVQVVGTDVFVTFNEDLTVPVTTNALDAFVVKVNGTELASSGVTNLVPVIGNAKQVKFTLTAAPAATPVVTVKADQVALTDANGVAVK